MSPHQSIIFIEWREWEREKPAIPCCFAPCAAARPTATPMPSARRIRFADSLAPITCHFRVAGLFFCTMSLPCGCGDGDGGDAAISGRVRPSPSAAAASSTRRAELRPRYDAVRFQQLADDRGAPSLKYLTGVIDRLRRLTGCQHANIGCDCWGR
jgi:hypothetical protein